MEVTENTTGRAGDYFVLLDDQKWQSLQSCPYQEDLRSLTLFNSKVLRMDPGHKIADEDVAAAVTVAKNRSNWSA